MRKSLEIYRSIAEQAADSIFVTDEWSRIIYQNPEARKAFGFSDEELFSHRVHEKIHRRDADGGLFPLEECKVYRAAVYGETARGFVWELSRRDGSRFFASCTSSPLYFDGERIGALLFATDITVYRNAEDALSKSAEQRIRAATQHDGLTGLPNRSLLFEYCTHLLAMSERTGDAGAVLFIDLDRFKSINDLYGHKVGDRVLQEVARRLLACTRKEDIVSRLGGDEFIVVLPRIDSTQVPATVAQHLLDEIGRPFRIDALQLALSPSIGISLFPAHSGDLETLVRYADLAMCSVKQSGRNGFRTYTPGLDERTNDLLRLEIHLKQALESDGMALFYQPIIDIETGRLIGAEALIRLPDDNGELLSPEQFIPVAESAGLINRLGDWVATEACRQHRHWRNAGLPPVSIAINVSPAQFRQRAFAAQLAATVEESGIDPQCLQIEVTESMVMDNLPETIATLHKIRSMGIRIALDDFGTGYSSLSYLGSLPLDKLKIDRSFISKIGSSQPSQSITEAIIALGRSLNLKVVGEGIESEQAWEYLRDHGCDQGQGYLFSKPLPAAEFESWYRRHLVQYH